MKLVLVQGVMRRVIRNIECVVGKEGKIQVNLQMGRIQKIVISVNILEMSLF